MFHAPTTENKSQNDPRRNQSMAEQGQELSPPVPATPGPAWSGAVAGGVFPRANNRGMQQQFARLHSAYGNQAILRMLSPVAPVIQTKLTVNQAGDQYEREADQVADHVMRMTPAPSVQRKCSFGQGEDKLQRKCSECEEEEKNTALHRKEATAGPQSAPRSVHAVLQSPGRPLDLATRAFFEPRFGRDFGRVRVHADSSAAESARAVNARAYAVGNHMVFGTGEYEPASEAGRKLLAHELAHVTQQGGNNTVIQRMAPCPAGFADPPPAGWKPYHGSSSVFHCGFRGILEDRTPTRDDPQNECFYDEAGTLVDEHHPYSGCRGTPNQYDSAQHPILHTLIDSGGIVRAGAPALAESTVHQLDDFFSRLDSEVRKLYWMKFVYGP